MNYEVHFISFKTEISYRNQNLFIIIFLINC